MRRIAKAQKTPSSFPETRRERARCAPKSKLLKSNNNVLEVSEVRSHSGGQTRRHESRNSPKQREAMVEGRDVTEPRPLFLFLSNVCIVVVHKCSELLESVQGAGPTQSDGTGEASSSSEHGSRDIRVGGFHHPINNNVALRCVETGTQAHCPVVRGLYCHCHKGGTFDRRGRGVTHSRQLKRLSLFVLGTEITPLWPRVHIVSPVMISVGRYCFSILTIAPDVPPTCM